MEAKAFIIGCAGPDLTDDERAFIKDERPWGLILFQRNCQSPDQIRALNDEFRALLDNEDAPVLIDEEGGRVQRLKPPVWASYPPSAIYGQIYQTDRDAGRRGAELAARLIAGDLEPLGITIDCLPVLDVGRESTHDAIGDRAYGSDPDQVADLAGAAARGLQAGGVIPVVKHMPGHGAAVVDSHHDLPVIEESCAQLECVDFKPFAALSHLPVAMTGHLVYSDLDSANPSTLSQIIVNDVIRRRIGFDGLLLTDDISMHALSGDIASRSRRALDVGCDIVLHCNGDMEEMRQVASVANPLRGKAKSRADRALASRRPSDQAPLDDLRREFSELLARFGFEGGGGGS